MPAIYLSAFSRFHALYACRWAKWKWLLFVKIRDWSGINKLIAESMIYECYQGNADLDLQTGQDGSSSCISRSGLK